MQAMKPIYGLMLLCFLLLMGSCHNNKTQSADDNAADTLPPDEKVVNGVVQLDPSRFEDTVTWNGKVYHYAIVKQPDATLPKVKEDGSGTLFADNHIDLTITLEGKQVFKKRFFKTSFDSHLDAGFRKKGILEGLVFDIAVPGGLQFATSICYPHSDLYIPLVIVVDPVSGGMTVKKDDIMDTDTEDADGV